MSRPTEPIALRHAPASPRWRSALAATLVTVAAWAGASEVARAGNDLNAPVPVNQALRALARLMRGKAGGEALRAASRQHGRAACAGRQPSELRWLRATPPQAKAG